MPAASAPIKVDVDTDRLISHAAHFLGKAKKDVVDAAVREYVTAHRDEINAGVRDALRQLDGTPASAVSLLTGISADRLDEYGGMPDGR
jgi:predicted transcriptional regulator